MAVLDFPLSPTVGQKYPTAPIIGQPVYTWDGEKWTTVGGLIGDTGAATELPLMDGIADVGVSLKWTREDHVHPTDTSLASGLADKVDVAGDTMAGALVLPAGSATATSLNFGSAGTGLFGVGTTDLKFSTVNTTRLTMTATELTSTLPIVLPADPTSALEAATKQYVDVGRGARFRITRGGANQTGLTRSTFNKVQFTSEDVDSGGWFNNSTTYRFTPLLAGWYSILLNVGIIAGGTGGETPQAAIYKNGTVFASGPYSSAGFSTQSGIAALVSLNGSTDYVEGFVYIPAAGVNSDIVNGNTATTHFSGTWIGPP